jgi:hypothetical protein
MRRAGCPGMLHQQPKDMMAAHGTSAWDDDLPPNVKLVIDDSKSHEVFLDYVQQARLVVIPRFKDDIGPAGIAHILDRDGDEQVRDCQRWPRRWRRAY